MIDTRAQIKPETLDAVLAHMPGDPSTLSMRFWNVTSTLKKELAGYTALREAIIRAGEPPLPNNYLEILNPSSAMVGELHGSRGKYTPEKPFYAELERVEWDYSWIEMPHINVAYRLQSGIFVPQNESYVGLGFPSQIPLNKAPEWVNDLVKHGKPIDVEDIRFWDLDLPDPSKVTITSKGVHVEYNGKEPAYLPALRKILDKDALKIERHEEMPLDLSLGIGTLEMFFR